MAQPGEKPFFDQLMENELIEQNVFAFFLSFNPRSEDSEVTFGYYDESRYEPGTMTWHPVVNKNFFAIELLDIMVGG